MASATRRLPFFLRLCLWGGYDCFQVVIHRFTDIFILHHAVKILIGHGDGTIDQIAEGVSQFGVQNASTISSQVITPSFSKGISCRTKYRTASHRKSLPVHRHKARFPWICSFFRLPAAAGMTEDLFGQRQIRAIRKMGQ